MVSRCPEGTWKAVMIDAQLSGDADYLCHLFGVAFRHPALFKVQIVLQTYTDIPAQEQGPGADVEPGASGNADGKLLKVEILTFSLRNVDILVTNLCRYRQGYQQWPPPRANLLPAP